MNRHDVFAEIEKERTYQDAKWGTAFDDKNTPNDWVSYLVLYTGKAVTMPFNREAFRSAVLKVATLCIAILERDAYSLRHYDTPSEG